MPGGNGKHRVQNIKTVTFSFLSVYRFFPIVKFPGAKVRLFFRTLLFNYKCKMFIFSNSHYLLMFLLHNYGFRGSNRQYISKRKQYIKRLQKYQALFSYNVLASSHAPFYYVHIFLHLLKCWQFPSISTKENPKATHLLTTKNGLNFTISMLCKCNNIDITLQ